jgi:hypothetical protein
VHREVKLTKRISSFEANDLCRIFRKPPESGISASVFRAIVRSRHFFCREIDRPAGNLLILDLGIPVGETAALFLLLFGGHPDALGTLNQFLKLIIHPCLHRVSRK